MKNVLAFIVATFIVSLVCGTAMAQDSTHFDVGVWDQSSIWLQDNHVVMYKRINTKLQAVGYQVFYRGDDVHTYAYTHVKKGGECFFRGVRTENLYRKLPCLIFQSMDRTYNVAVDAYLKNLNKPIQKM